MAPKVNRRRASEHPDVGKTVMIPIAKLPKRKKPESRGHR